MQSCMFGQTASVCCHGDIRKLAWFQIHVPTCKLTVPLRLLPFLACDSWHILIISMLALMRISPPKVHLPDRCANFVCRATCAVEPLVSLDTVAENKVALHMMMCRLNRFKIMRDDSQMLISVLSLFLNMLPSSWLSCWSQTGLCTCS